MGRVINTNSPGKRRNHLMRTIAELLRRLAQKQSGDDDTRDMLATIVFCLRDIDSTIIESIQAWEKRGYWQKADKFQQQWGWAEQMSHKIEKLVLNDEWDTLPDVLMQLFPHFAGIEINKMTRKPDVWEGAYDELLAETE